MSSQTQSSWPGATVAPAAEAQKAVPARQRSQTTTAARRMCSLTTKGYACPPPRPLLSTPETHSASQGMFKFNVPPGTVVTECNDVRTQHPHPASATLTGDRTAPAPQAAATASLRDPGTCRSRYSTPGRTAGASARLSTSRSGRCWVFTLGTYVRPPGSLVQPQSIFNTQHRKLMYGPLVGSPRSRTHGF